MNSNELYQFYVTLSSFSNWPVFSAFFFSVARADRGGSSSFSYSLHSTNTYGPNTFQKITSKNGFERQGTFKLNYSMHNDNLQHNRIITSVDI